MKEPNFAIVILVEVTVDLKDLNFVQFLDVVAHLEDLP